MTGPGLDLDRLRALRTSPRDLTRLRRRIAAHLDEHEGYVAFSGGKDSLVVLHLAVAASPRMPVVFFDSGLEFPETYTYLEELSHRWHLNLSVFPAQPSALQILATCGAWDHRRPDRPTPDLHRALITEPAARAHTAHGPGELWGVRAEESRGRAAAYANALRAAPCRCPSTCTSQQHRATHGGVIERRDGTVAFGPVWDWKTPEIWSYISRHELPLNPVYAKLRRLGAPDHFLRISGMVDANRLEEGRITWLRRGWPEIFDELAAVLPRLREFV